MKRFLLTVFCAGCFSVDIPDGQLKCSAIGECPTGYTCDVAANVCRRNGDPVETPDASANTDAREGDAAD